MSVHAGAAVVDLSLPAEIPIGTLIPPIVDILEGRDADGSNGLVGRHYRLSLPGAPDLDASTTLAQNGIRDGAVVVLSQARTPPPSSPCDDVAEAVSATLNATTRRSNQSRDRPATRLTSAAAASCLTGIGAMTLIRNALSLNVARYLGATAGVAALAGFVALLFAVFAHRAHSDSTAGITLCVIATVFAAVAGFLAVPGAPGPSSVLLAAMGAAVMAVLAMRLSGCGVVTLTAVSCFAMVVAVAALAGVITGAPLHIIGSVSALVSLGLLGVAARLSIVLAGLSPRLPPAPDLDTPDCLAAKAIRADNWLTSLIAAFSCSAAVAAIITLLTGAPKLNCIAFATVTGSLLLLYARGADGRRTLLFVASGIVTTGTTFGITAAGAQDHGPWIAATTAVLAAAAIYLGFVAPAMSLSPVVRRSLELLEYLALTAMVPLTFWICGLYGTVRGLHPTWN